MNRRLDQIARCEAGERLVQHLSPAPGHLKLEAGVAEAAAVGERSVGAALQREEARLVLVSDVLWMEQNLRFQFEQTEERLAAMLESAGEGDLAEADFRARARLIAQANPAVVGLPISGAEVSDEWHVIRSTRNLLYRGT